MIGWSVDTELVKIGFTALKKERSLWILHCLAFLSCVLFLLSATAVQSVAADSVCIAMVTFACE